ncbi:MAG: hypothetical protein M9894_34610 [Planctomycetes bacterium]|nr:hypothetical protein [Planctomycetota bacterium]
MSWFVRAATQEVRARAPVALGAAALGLGAGLLSWGAPALDPSQGALPLLERWRAAPAALALVLLLGLALRAARGLVGGEVGEGSDQDDDPLAALPVRPAAALAVRLAACAVVLALAPLARHLVGLAHGLVAGPALEPGRWPPLALLDLAQVAAALGAAALARPLGVVAWPALGAGALALTLAGRDGLVAPALDPLRLAAARPDLPALLVAGGWVAAAGLAVALAAALARTLQDAGLGRVLAAAGAYPANARLAALAGALLVVAAPLCAEPVAPARDDALADDLVSARTRRYRFVYPAALAGPARALVAQADALHDAVALALGVPPAEVDAPLELTLAPPGEGGHEACRGVALDPHAAPALAHATAHALLARALGPLDAEAAWTLEEGLCERAAWQATGGDPFAPRFVAAVLHVRRPFEAEEARSRRALERARGPEAAAPLGEALVEALRRLAGDDAPLRLLGAVGRPSREPARARWAAGLAALGLDAGALHHEALVVIEDTAPADPRADVDLPRLVAAPELVFDSLDLKLVAIPDVPLPPGWDVVCRVVLDPDDPGAQVLPAVRLGRDPSGCWAFSRRHGQLSLRLGPPARVQLGLRPSGPGPFRGTIWEDWAQLPTVP